MGAPITQVLTYGMVIKSTSTHEELEIGFPRDRPGEIYLMGGDEDWVTLDRAAATRLRDWLSAWIERESDVGKENG